MRVALVTPWATACGIAEHAAMLVEAVQAADPSIAITPITDLHPSAVRTMPERPDVIVLNYQAALLSQWTPEALDGTRARRGAPVVVIYHDTGVPNSDQCKGIAAAANATIVHEPAEDLQALGRIEYWRMGVPAWEGIYQHADGPRSWSQGRPILGTVGFPFGWKNYDQLAQITREVGWALLLIAPTAREADLDRWQTLNPCTRIEPSFLHRRVVVGMLAGCDATAFMYTCANTGQSGALLQGIAARKPVIALETCRQFRALRMDQRAHHAIRWVGSFESLRTQLEDLFPHRFDPGIVALAEQESWAKLGVKYAALFHELAR